MGLTKTITRKTLPRGMRNWLRSPMQSLHWGWCEFQAGMGRLAWVDLREDWRFRSHPGAEPFAYHVQNDDPEQRREFDGFVARCTPGMRLFDLGAHFGLFSLAALHYGGSSAESVAVDPSPLAMRMVAFQAKVNKVADRLYTRLAAAGADVGTTSMVAAGIESAGYFVSPTVGHPLGEQTCVPTVSVDALASEFGRPTHLKIDVEGAEWSVLQGAAATLLRADAPMIFLELHNEILRERGDDPCRILDHLQERGFRLLNDCDEPIQPDATLAPPVVRLVAEPIR
jgi:FkbM family methyltransferase